MDRTIVYPGELPRLEDFMGFQKDALYALGYLAQAMLGSPTAVAGLACTQTGSASLNVVVGVGSIYEIETVDATAYGALGTDQNTILKQGLLETPVTLAVTPPSTAGYTQFYLVEASYNDIDGSPVLLPYYNAANSAQPLSGPGNAGTQDNTVRAGVCSIALKAGAAAPTGAASVPAPDAGYVGLWVIRVTNGQTSITSANISLYAAAPFIPLTLPQVPVAIQEQTGNWSLDTGSANAVAITLPSYTTVTAGMPVRIKKSGNGATGAVTITINGGSTYSAVWEDGTAFINGDWPANAVGEGIFDGAVFRMAGPIGPSIFARASSVANINSQTATIYNNLTTSYPSLLPPRNILLERFTHGSGTVTVPANVTQIRFRFVGAGGGGGAGGGSISNFSGGGGGSGGYCEGWAPVSPGQVISYTIGQGGAGASANNTTATGGGTTTVFGSSATGGGGGIISTGETSAGGPPGVGSGGAGTVNFPGSAGGDGNPYVAYIQGGSGGASAWGGGGRTATIGLPASTAANGVAPGSGGGGIWGGNAGNSLGGSGADGGMILEY